MEDSIASTAGTAALGAASVEEIKHDHQAYSILHWGFTALPVIAGIDKLYERTLRLGIVPCSSIRAVSGAAPDHEYCRGY
jgi:hypothetical protein